MLFIKVFHNVLIVRKCHKKIKSVQNSPKKSCHVQGFLKVNLVTKMVTSNRKMVTSNLYHRYVRKKFACGALIFPF